MTTLNQNNKSINIKFVDTDKVSENSIEATFELDGTEFTVELNNIHHETGEVVDYDLQLNTKSVDRDLANRVDNAILAGETDDNKDIDLYLYIRDSGHRLANSFSAMENTQREGVDMKDNSVDEKGNYIDPKAGTYIPYEFAETAMREITKKDRQDRFSIKSSPDVKKIDDEKYSAFVMVSGDIPFRFVHEGIRGWGKVEIHYDIDMEGELSDTRGFTPTNQVDQLDNDMSRHRFPCKDMMINVLLKGFSNDQDGLEFKEQFSEKLTEYLIDEAQHISGVAYRMSISNKEEAELNRSHDKLREGIAEKIKLLESKSEKGKGIEVSM